MIDITRVVEKGVKLYDNFKKNGEVGFCCLSDETLILLNMILQMARREGLKVKIKVKLDLDKE